MQHQPTRLSLSTLLIALLAFLLLAMGIKAQQATISPLSAEASLERFSAERAYQMLGTLTHEQVPHSVDSAANRVVETRLITLLSDMGYQAQVQETQACFDAPNGYARCAKIRNTIVYIKGSHTQAGILLSAHYDSVPAGPGGSDAGAAVGSLLEIARLLSLQPPPKNPIVLLFNEGEEFGLLGARAFMEQHPLAKQLQLAINIEARGSTGQSVMFETGENSGHLVKHYAQTTPAPMSSSLFYEVYKFLPNDTDLSVFKEYGLQGLNFAHAERLVHYHTPLDNLANLDRGSLQHHGDNVWGVLSRIKEADLTTSAKGNLVYTDVMGLFMLHWQEDTSFLLAAAIMSVLLLALVLLYRQQQWQTKPIVFGMLGLLVVLASSGATAMLLTHLSQILSGHDAPWNTNGLPMQLTLWLGVLLVGLLLGRLLSRRFSPLTMMVTVTIAWCVLTLVSSLVMPGISYLFLIPALVSVCGLLVMAWRVRANIPHGQAFWSLLMAITAAVVFMPLAYLLEVMVTYEMAVAIGIMLGFILWGLLPLTCLTAKATRGFYQLCAGIGALMVITMAWTCWQPAFSPFLPQHLNLQYVQDEQGQALILAGHEHNTLPESLQSALPSAPQLSAALPWSSWAYHQVDVASQRLASPQVDVLARNDTSSGEQVTLRIRAGQPHSRDVFLYIPIEAGLTRIESFGQSLNYQDETTRYNGFNQYHCRGEACDDIEISLYFRRPSQATLWLVHSYAGLPPAYQSLDAARGNNAVPYQDGDVSMVYRPLTL